MIKYSLFDCREDSEHNGVDVVMISREDSEHNGVDVVMISKIVAKQDDFCRWATPCDRVRDWKLVYSVFYTERHVIKGHMYYNLFFIIILYQHLLNLLLNLINHHEIDH